MFDGPVRDFVSICLWVSRDTDREDLATLLSRRVTDAEFRDATGALTCAHISAAAAAGGSAVLCHIADELLDDGSGSRIRLFRTAFGADHRFGAGRHPAVGVHSARGVSFSMNVVTAGLANQ